MDEADVNIVLAFDHLQHPQSVGKQWQQPVMPNFTGVTEAHSLQRAVENITVDILSHLHTH